MIPRWQRRDEETALLRLALLPVWGVSQLYGLAASAHRELSERGWLSRRRLPCAVVSVGSLLVGGTGKTPLAAWIARELRGRGHRVVLASRGYRGRGREAVAVVSDGQRLCNDVREVGDEPLVLVAHAPGVPVLVGRDRGVVGLRAVSAFGAEVLVLDDGFQHHRLDRDVEVATFDAKVGLGNGHVLPRGPLREPLSALSRADAVCVVDGSLAPADQKKVEGWAPEAPQFRLHRRPVSLRSLRGDGRQSVDELSGMRVGVLAGIAEPANFRRTLEALGAEVAAVRIFPDHHRYRPRDLRGLAVEVPVWITTEKDAVKILPSWAPDLDLRVLGIELEAEDPPVLANWLEARVNERLQSLRTSSSSRRRS